MRRSLHKICIVFALLCMLVVALTLCASAETKTGTCGDNLTYTLDTGTLTISGTGAMWDWSRSSYVPWYANRSSIRTVKIADSVTSIGECAFAACSSLTSITIPDSVTSIGYSAFSGCSSLTSITIPDSVTSIGGSAFMYCSSLKSITIPDGVTRINSYTFCFCSSLTSITIPDSVTYIREHAFSGCSSLAIYITDFAAWCRINFADEWFSYPHQGFGYDLYLNGELVTDLVIPDGITKFASRGLTYCKSLISVIIPDSVTSIGSYVFKGCLNIESITAPFDWKDASESYASLGNIFIKYQRGVSSSESFPSGYDWSKLPSYPMADYYYYDGVPSSLREVVVTRATAIPPRAFRDYNHLENISIPAGVNQIFVDAFSGCSGLKGIHVADDNATYASVDGVLFNKAKTVLLKAPCALSGTYSIPEGVTRIRDKAFSGCRLESITIPDSVTSIGDCAFQDCYNLSTVFYGGTETQHKRISISNSSDHSGGCNKALINAHWLYCVTKAENNWRIAEGDAAVYLGEQTTISVPETIGGNPVSRIAYISSSVVNITIGDFVTGILDSAFDDTSLRRVNYTGTAAQWNKIEIGENNAPLVNAEKSFYVSEFGDFLVARGGVLVGYTGDAVHLTIPTQIEDYQIKKIGSYAFAGSQLQRVLLPVGVEAIEACAFDNSALIHLYYAGSEDEWKDISVSKNNQGLNAAKQYTDVFLADAFAVDKSGRLLARWDTMDVQELIIPETVGDVTVKHIVSNALRGLTALENLTIPDSVVSIEAQSIVACDKLNAVSLPFVGASRGSEKTMQYIFKNVPNSLCTISITDATIIPKKAFKDCNSLTSVTLGNGMTNVGQYAFSGCRHLIDINIPDSVTSIEEYAFSGCSSLTSIAIPDSVTSIGEYAFSNCSNLESVTIGSGVTRIGQHAFSGCSSLESVTIPDSVVSIGGYTFSNCSSLENVTLGNGVTNIGQYAFSSCRHLASVTIPDSMTCIGEYIFSNCSSLENVTVGNGVTRIGQYAFSGCSSLTNITIPDSVISIEEYAFYNCSSLVGVAIGNGVTSLGRYAFKNCTGLKAIHINDIAAWCKIPFESDNYNPLTYAHNLYFEDELITDLVIPDGVTAIGQYAFSGCSSLASITIPGSVTSIGANAFRDCSSLNAVHITDLSAWCSIPFESAAYNPLSYVHNLYLNDELVTDLVIPDGVTSIGQYAFYGCTNLTSVTIPDSVTSIGKGAFSDCDNLKAVYINDLARFAEINFADATANPLYNAKHLYLNDEPVKQLALPEGTTKISSFAFAGCVDLVGVTLPRSLESIGQSAFSGCSGIKSMTMPFAGTARGTGSLSSLFGGTSPSSLTRVILTDETALAYGAFSGCKSLTAVALPETLTAIGNYAFANCTGMTAIVLPASVKSFSANIFNGISGFENVYYTGSEEEWNAIQISGSSNVFDSAEIYYNCRIFGDFVIHGGDTILAYLGTDVYVDMPAEVDGTAITKVGDYAFYGNMEVRSISIPDGVLTVGENAFNGCTALTNVKISGSLEKIAKNGFRNCKALTQITIPLSLKSVGSYAFDGCDALAEVFYAGSNEDWDAITIYAGNDPLSRAKGYYKLLIEGDYTMTGNTLIGYTGSDVVVRIPSALRTIPVQAIASYVFENNGTAELIVIPDGVSTIGDYVFRDAANLVGVVIPASVTTIGTDILSGCSAKTTIYGAAGSAAETYAQENQIPFVVLGADTHIYSAKWTVDTPASCTAPGEKSHHCIFCDDCGMRADVTVIPQKGHNYGAWQVRTTAGCETTGVEYRICTVCQHEDTRTTNALGHDYSMTWTVDTPAKCATPGSKSHHCTRCDAKTDVTEIPATGAHKFADTFTIDVPATCSTVGSKSRHCTVCDAKTDITEIPKTAHDYSTTWTIDTPAKCTTPGSKSHHCKNCDAVRDVTAIPATGHKPAADWTIDVAAGCVTDGSKSHHCTVCDEKLDVTVIPAVGVHKDADGDGKCDDCGKLFGEGWELDDATGELTVTGSGTVTDTNWKTVADKVKVIKIDSGITSLPDDAFAGCTDITIRCEAGSYAADYARDHGYKTSFINSTETADGTVVAKGLADGAIPEGTTLTVTPVDKSEIPASVLEKLGKEPEFDVIDIVMEKDGEAMQPNGRVTITIPVADGEKRRKVYRVNEDGTLTDMNAKADGDNLIFDTDTTGRYLVQVRKFIPGVVTGEGETPMKKDLLRLQKYLAGWDVEIDEAAADCNGDGQISKADLLRLQKYLAGWDVKLGE